MHVHIRKLTFHRDVGGKMLKLRLNLAAQPAKISFWTNLIDHSLSDGYKQSTCSFIRPTNWKISKVTSFFNWALDAVLFLNKNTTQLHLAFAHKLCIKFEKLFSFFRENRNLLIEKKLSFSCDHHLFWFLQLRHSRPRLIQSSRTSTTWSQKKDDGHVESMN